MWTVFPCNVNHQIRLHSARMVTVLMWTDKALYTRCLMHLIHVLLKTALLNESLCTSWETTLVV
jgi:hypothetical protein